MPLVLLCGQPCSGKSTVAKALAAALEASLGRTDAVLLIDEPGLGLVRNAAYKDSPSEKNLRGVLRSAVERSVTKEKFVILDSLNNIKGYRYELWCIARAAGTSYCVVHTVVQPETPEAWNRGRVERGEEGYSDEILQDLVRRFERPDGRNRWDSPLYELHMDRDSPEDVKASVANIAGALLGRGQGVGVQPRDLQPTMATQSAPGSGPNVLYEMDRATQEIVTAIADALALASGSIPVVVSLGPELPPLKISRHVGFVELRKHKRNFMKFSSSSGLSGKRPSSDSLTTKLLFYDYLQQELS